MTDIQQLEEEIKALEKERDQAEHEFNVTDAKERRHLAELQKKSEAKSLKRQRGEPNNNDIEMTEEKEVNNIDNDEQANKRPRRPSSNIAEKQKDFEEGEAKQPKLTSAIVGASGEKPSGRNASTKEADPRQRNRKMFGVLVGTLNKFKQETNAKSEAALRREKLEKEVEQKVQQDHEALLETLTVELKQRREAAQAKKEELKQKVQEKQTELLNLKWNTHKNHLAHFIKTETKPHIYYKPVDKANGTTNASIQEKQDNSINSGQDHSRSGSKSPDRNREDKQVDAMESDEK